MRYLVYGTGAVGALLGGRLALGGHPVTFLARPRVAEALERDGLHLGGAIPAAWLPEPKVARSLDQAFTGSEPPEVILLTVKAYDCEAAAERIGAASDNPPPVVCLLNGVGNEATLAARLGRERVIAAALTTAVLMPEPGRVRVERERGLGLAADHRLALRLASEFTEAGMRVRLHPNPGRMKWSKLMTNVVANATSAITGWTPRDVFSHAGLYRLEIEALREVVRVMRADGLRPENLAGVPIRLMTLALALPPRVSQPVLMRAVASGRGGKRPSFHYDIGRGRSEVTWLNGAVVREGARLGILTPANAVLTEVMLGLVHRRLSPEAFLNKPHALLGQAQAAGVPGIRGYNAAAE